MKSKQLWISVVYVCVSLAALVSCATTQRQHVRTKVDFDEVYSACIDAMIDVRFGVSSSDSKTGLIVAEQAVMGGHGTTVKLNVMVKRVGDTTEVKVNYIPAPGTGGGWGTATAYIKALKKRIPDVEIVEIATSKQKSGRKSDK